MKLLPQTRPGCGCLFGSFSLATMTVCGLLVIQFSQPAGHRYTVVVTIVPLAIFLGACGACLGSVGALLRPGWAAVFGALLMGVPFCLLLIQSLLGVNRLTLRHVGAEAFSGAVMGAALSILAGRVVHFVRSSEASMHAETPRRFQFRLSTLILVMVLVASLIAFLETAWKGLLH